MFFRYRKFISFSQLRVQIPEPSKHEKAVEPVQASNALHIAVPQQQQQLTLPESIPRRTRSPRPVPVPPPARASTLPELHSDRESRNITSSHLLAPLSQLGLPERTRSPVPRKKVPQEHDVKVVRPTSPVADDLEREVDGFVSVAAATTVTEEPERVFHAAMESRRRPKAARAKLQEEVRANDISRDPVPAKALTDSVPIPLVVPEKGTPRSITPPPRAPSRNAVKTTEVAERWIPGNKTTQKTQSHTAAPSSPPPAVRPSSPLPPETTPVYSMHQAHMQKQHYHEVHQPFRPPTPPTTSHYRKKRSFDLLPTEAFPTFMKPPMHVVSSNLYLVVAHTHARCCS